MNQSNQLLPLHSDHHFLHADAYVCAYVENGFAITIAIAYLKFFDIYKKSLNLSVL